MPEDIAEVVAMWTGVPVNRIAGEERERLLEMEKVMRLRIIGQDEPIKAISKAVRSPMAKSTRLPVSKKHIDCLSKAVGPPWYRRQTWVGRVCLFRWA